VLVVTSRQDSAEAINSILRNGGIPLHYRRANTAEAAAELMDTGFDLGIVFSDEDPDLLAGVLYARDRIARDFPILSCRENVDPDLLGADVIAGAADMITPSQRRRLFKVFERELRSARLGRALREAVGTAASYREQLPRLESAVRIRRQHGAAGNSNHGPVRGGVPCLAEGRPGGLHA
jgi:hypothetical protein